MSRDDPADAPTREPMRPRRGVPRMRRADHLSAVERAQYRRVMTRPPTPQRKAGQ